MTEEILLTTQNKIFLKICSLLGREILISLNLVAKCMRNSSELIRLTSDEVGRDSLVETKWIMAEGMGHPHMGQRRNGIQRDRKHARFVSHLVTFLDIIWCNLTYFESKRCPIFDCAQTQPFPVI